MAIGTVFKTKKERQEEMQENQTILRVKDERSWLLRHGKGHVLNFTDD